MGSNAKLPREQFLTKRQMFLIEMVKRVLQERFDITGEMLQWTMKHEPHPGTAGWWKYVAIVRHRPYALEAEASCLDTARVSGRVFWAPELLLDGFGCPFEVGVSSTDLTWRPSGPNHLEVFCSVMGGVLMVDGE